MLFGRITFQTVCLAAAIAAIAVSPGALCLEAVAPTNPYLGPHVRGVTAEMNRVIEQGTRRSPTFRSLVEALNRSDVIVYLESTKNLPLNLDGRLVFLTSAGGVRYLHVQVAKGLGFNEVIAIAGHELQHAVEVATHAEVHDSASLAVLYERIGIREVHNRYDTQAAQLAGKRVRAELS
jgi:hypothetical protein